MRLLYIVILFWVWGWLFPPTCKYFYCIKQLIIQYFLVIYLYEYVKFNVLPFVIDDLSFLFTLSGELDQQPILDYLDWR